MAAMLKPSLPLFAALSAASLPSSALPVQGGCLAVELRALEVAPGVPSRIKLLPAGAFQSVDGRPGNLPGSATERWLLTPARGAALAAGFAARKQQMLVDYEHQTLRAEKNGLPNPAAAWIGALEYLPEGPDAIHGAGLYGSVHWTAKAAALVAAQEYLYLSPVFTFDAETGEVLALLHVALTNTPGLNTDALPELQAQLSALAASQFSTMPDEGSLPTPPQEKPMKLLLAALGLSAAASEEAGMTALAALQAQVTTKDAQIVELRAKQFDPAQHIPLTEHTKVAEQLAALTALSEKTEGEQLMAAMLADSRILPANADYWKAQPLAALKVFAAVAKPLAAALTQSQTQGKPPGAPGTTVALTADELAVCSQLGIKPDDFAATKSGVKPAAKPAATSA